MENYADKLYYLYKHQQYRCPVCRDLMTMQEGLDLHHRNHPAKWKRKKWPLFLDSLLNLWLIHTTCHAENRSAGKIGDRQAERWELFLQKHKKICDFVNSPLT